MNNIIQTIRHTARAATVLLLALLTAQTAGAQTNVSNAAGLVAAFDDTNVSVVNVTDNITGVGGLSLNRALTINLNGHTISGDGLYFDVGPNRSLTINGEGLDGSVGNIISGYANIYAINNYGTVTLSHVNITTNSDHAIGGTGMLYIGNNVSFNGWTDRPFDTRYVKDTEDGNYSGTVVATVTVGGKTHNFENLGAALVYIAKHTDTTLVTPDLSADFSWSGDTYTIHTAKGWGYFCDMLEAGETFSGKTVELANDITVTRMAGGQPFTGTFDGQNHKLTLAYGTADAPVDAQFVAPFVETARDTSPVFRNLTIDGTIYATHTAATDHDHVGGLIGHLFGDVTIEHCVSRVEIHAKGGAGGFVGLCEHSVSFTDCHSSAVITSPGGNNSGFVGWSRASGWNINFTGCLFDGKLLQQNGNGASNGGFIGWTGSNKTVTITNSLCAPAPLADGEKMASSNSATFARGWNATTTATNCYYTAAFDIAQGKARHTVTAGTDVTIEAIALTGTATQYTVSGITAYSGGGLQRGETLYYGIDDKVSLTLSNTATGAPDGYQYGYTTNAGTLEGSTLTMPNQDVTVSVNTEVLVAIDWATVSTGADKDNAYMIYNNDQLDLLAYRVNGTHGETAVEDGYSGKYFKLGKDIKYTHTTDWDDTECEQESNFEPIGGRYNGDYRSFRGHFDGNNNTISGIRIYKGGNDAADKYQGIFGQTNSGADIHDLTLADARITGYESTGGIVGSNYGTVTGCHVADDVAVCAVQYNALYHGGIVGNNRGTIEQCTSAATLTTADADNSYYYGGIAGINYVTLRDNLAIGATVPATKDNSYGAITGHNNYGTLQRNYYTACKVADTENATNVGCGYIDDGNGGYITADVNNVNNPNGAVSIHTLTLADGITTTTAATVTIGTTGYYAQGTAIALSYSGTIGEGYQLGIVRNDGNGFTAAVADGSGNYTAVMPAANATATDHAPIDWATVSTGADKDNAYMIYNNDQLDLLAHRVNGTHGETAVEDGYSGKFFKLANDISYPHKADGEEGADAESNYEAIGGYYDGYFRSFCGHFDGNNNTISGIRLYKDGDGNADSYQGIFGQTYGADIHHLTLANARITGYNSTGGIVGFNTGGGTVTRCHVADDVAVYAVQSNVWYHGGIVGENGCTIEQCTSAATLTTADADNSRFYGGIAGINYGTLSDNLAIGATVPAAADNTYGAITGENDGGTLQRNYYAACKVADVENATGVGCGYISDGNGGRITADVTANNPNGAVSIHTLTLADGITTSTPVTVTIGTTGYYAQGTAIALSYSGTTGDVPDGYQYGFTTNAGTLSGSTLTMPDQDVTVSVNTAILTAIPWDGDGTEGSPYIIEYASQLDLLAYRVNGTHGETANDYYNTYFQLNNDIKYTPSDDWDDFDSDESNYEAIGGYYNDGYRSFSGHFDGNKKTISGIRIYKDGTGNADCFQGIFGLTGSGADIHHLTLADARITCYGYTGGIVGYNDGATVTHCHVAGDVAVCVVQSGAYCYGGIVGNNWGTIEQCTSAATLTIANAAKSYDYGGIAGINYGTLSDNLAIGATVPAAADNTYGAITGDNGGTLLRNYYAACKVADVENATGVGCGYIGNDDDGYITADVTANNGAVSIHTLTLADGITTSTPVTVTIGTTGYYAQGTAIALSYSGTPGNIPLGYQYEDGDGFTASAGTISGSTLTMPAADVTVSLAFRSTGVAVPVTYVDADGTTKNAQAIALDGHETVDEFGNVNLTAGWYFVGTDIAFDHTLDLSGDVHLILADGCTMNVTSSNADGIDVDGSLTIYGQTDGTGTLNATSVYGDGIYSDSGTITISGGRVTVTGGNDGIYTDSGTITISGGTVTATSDNGDGIYSDSGTITISGGRVTATGGIGITTHSGDITISGGRVTATGGYSFGISTNGGTITLGCTTASDFIYASSYDAGPEGSLNIADGQTLYDEDGNYYSGTNIDYADPDGKTLRLYGIDLTANLAPDGNYWTTYYNSALGFTIEGNACAYTATYGDGKLTLHNQGKEIPKNTAVIIVADNDVVSMTATGLGDFTGDNDLRGVNVDTPVADIRSDLVTGTFYVLGMTTVGNEQHFGFHRYTGSEMAAHKAYVLVSGSQQALARSLTMVFDDATGIESAEADSSLFTLHSSLSTWFTLDGRRLQAKPTAPGIYVNNGRKVVIK